MKRTDHQWIQQVLDGEITREDFDGFQQRLREEPELAGLYREYALLHHTLCEEYEGGHGPGPAIAANVRGWLGLPVLVAAIAGALALGVVAWWFQPWRGGGERGDDAAVLAFSVDAAWRIDGTAHAHGGATGVAEGSVLHLVQGRASIVLDSTVSAVVEGPADVAFLAKNSLRLERGRCFFQCAGHHNGLSVTTPRLEVAEPDGRFGIEVTPDGADELHGIEGAVRFAAKGSGETGALGAGSAVRVPASGVIESLSAAAGRFAKGLGRFRTVMDGPFKREQWRLDYGNPTISESRIEGVNYSVFMRLPQAEPAGDDTVLLAMLEVGKCDAGEFHTDGWAGMSFFSSGSEVLFFGDAFGTKPAWALDVKQRIPVIVSEPPLRGPGTVTLRYDRSTGDVSLHEGGVPLKMPVCVGKLPLGTRFDEIRIGASAGAALAVKAVRIRAGGE